MTVSALPAALPLRVQAEGLLSVEALLDLVEAEREQLEARLLVHGALLFRGWQPASVADLRRFAAGFSGGAPFFGYAGGASPRKALGEGSYTSTEYPPQLQLSLHNELSYTGAYPSRLFFLCLAAPTEGGETTLGDSRRILARIDPDLLARFRSRQIRYIRNLSPMKGSGYSWQEAFGTEDPEAVEACCRRLGAGWRWRPDGVLQTSQIRPATALHPKTGEEVWFNQADGFHPSGLDPVTYQELILLCGSEEEFRLNVTYGDDSPIERGALDHIRAVIRTETIPHQWQAGDIVVVDNLLAAHGRMPFRGRRKIALAMT